MKETVIACNCCVFGIGNNEIKILLSKVSDNLWAIPEEKLNPEKSAEESIIDTLKEKFEIRPRFIDQTYTFSNVDRYPDNRTISISFFTIIDLKDFIPNIGTDKAEWFDIASYPSLVNDHESILKLAILKLEQRIKNSLNKMENQK